MADKAADLFSDCIDFMYLRYGKGERKPCPLDTPTARVMWDLWQLYKQGAPFKEVEDIVHIFCTIYGVPVAEAHGFVFEGDSIYGSLKVPA